MINDDIFPCIRPFKISDPMNKEPEPDYRALKFIEDHLIRDLCMIVIEYCQVHKIVYHEKHPIYNDIIRHWEYYIFDCKVLRISFRDFLSSERIPFLEEDLKLAPLEHWSYCLNRCYFNRYKECLSFTYNDGDSHPDTIIYKDEKSILKTNGIFEKSGDIISFSKIKYNPDKSYVTRKYYEWYDRDISPSPDIFCSVRSKFKPNYLWNGKVLNVKVKELQHPNKIVRYSKNYHKDIDNDINVKDKLKKNFISKSYIDSEVTDIHDINHKTVRRNSVSVYELKL